MNKISKEIIKNNNSLLAKKLFNYFSIFVFSYRIEKEDLNLSLLINCELYCDENQVLLLFFSNLLKKRAENIFKEDNLKLVLLEKIFLNFKDIIIDSLEVEEKNHYSQVKQKILKALKNSDVQISYQN